jgi:single-stranded DNA-specific DHH superfamily exonuclease
MFEELDGSGLLIHHWDTDGICSARLLLEKLTNKKIVNVTPELGNYFLTEEELSAYTAYDFIFVVDICRKIIKMNPTFSVFLLFNLF